MDVYLIPLGPDRHELYCEVDALAAGGDEHGAPSGFWRRQKARFQTMLAEAEAERARRERGEATDQGGLGRYIVRKIAESIAEQRLLWHLRHETASRLLHPDDMTGVRALEIARASMRADYGKHRRWCAIDSTVTAVTGPLFFFVPGPNIISWFFAFRAVGHFYALRGARRGADQIVWETVATDTLSTLRQALALDPPERRARLEQLAEALKLDRLASFVDRVAG
jgi:hypothetical protein